MKATMAAPTISTAAMARFTVMSRTMEKATATQGGSTFQANTLSTV